MGLIPRPRACPRACWRDPCTATFLRTTGFCPHLIPSASLFIFPRAPETAEGERPQKDCPCLPKATQRPLALPRRGDRQKGECAVPIPYGNGLRPVGARPLCSSLPLGVYPGLVPSEPAAHLLIPLDRRKGSPPAKLRQAGPPATQGKAQPVMKVVNFFHVSKLGGGNQGPSAPGWSRINSGYAYALARSGPQRSGSASESATRREAPVRRGGHPASRSRGGRKVETVSSAKAAHRAGLGTAAAEGAQPRGQRQQRGPTPILPLTEMS